MKSVTFYTRDKDQETEVGRVWNYLPGEGFTELLRFARIKEVFHSSDSAQFPYRDHQAVASVPGFFQLQCFRFPGSSIDLFHFHLMISFSYLIGPRLVPAAGITENILHHLS